MAWSAHLHTGRVLVGASNICIFRQDFSRGIVFGGFNGYSLLKAYSHSKTNFFISFPTEKPYLHIQITYMMLKITDFSVVDFAKNSSIDIGMDVR